MRDRPGSILLVAVLLAFAGGACGGDSTDGRTDDAAVVADTGDQEAGAQDLPETTDPAVADPGSPDATEVVDAEGIDLAGNDAPGPDVDTLVPGDEGQEPDGDTGEDVAAVDADPDIDVGADEGADAIADEGADTVVDPCSVTTCPEHATCAAGDAGALCTCDADYTLVDGQCVRIVTFPDPVLEACVRALIGKPTGDILSTDVASQPNLECPCEGNWIASLAGVEYFTSVSVLGFPNCQGIEDLQPIAGLGATLSYLNLRNNYLSDLGPLASLQGLIWLTLANNHIRNVGPLGALPSITQLSLSANPISDISPLAGHGYEELDIENCCIADLSPIQSLIDAGNVYGADTQGVCSK
jgi:hypothetical protein